jgi:MYXO-CTERM domain-containing protein
MGWYVVCTLLYAAGYPVACVLNRMACACAADTDGRPRGSIKVAAFALLWPLQVVLVVAIAIYAAVSEVDDRLRDRGV